MIVSLPGVALTLYYGLLCGARADDLGERAGTAQLHLQAPDVFAEDVEEPLALPLDALIPDANGEILVVDEAGLASLTVVTADAVLESGTADRNITADGEDVTGFSFLRFAGGPTLYYQADLDLRVMAPAGVPRKLAGA